MAGRDNEEFLEDAPYRTGTIKSLLVRIHEREDLISILEPERVIQPLACALQRPTRQSRPAEKPRIKPQVRARTTLNHRTNKGRIWFRRLNQER